MMDLKFIKSLKQTGICKEKESNENRNDTS